MRACHSTVGEPMEAMEESRETSSPFLRLSNEIIEMIFTSSTLKHDDVAALARVCARFAQISRSRELWRRKALERWTHWGFDENDRSRDWREIYRDRLRWQRRIYPAVKELSVLNFNQEDMSLDTVYRFDEIFDEYDCFPDTARVTLEEIRKSSAKSCDLTMKYYTDHVCEYVKVRQIEESMKGLLRRPDEEIDLVDGALLLSQWQNLWTPIDCDSVKSVIDEMAIRVQECLALSASQKKEEGSESVVLSCDMLDVMNHVMFHEFRFVGNVVDFFNPDNSYLDKVVEQRTGIPITLSILYIALGRRLGLSIQPVGAAHHFFVCCKGSKDPSAGCKESDVYVDVFDGGRFLDESECEHLKGDGHLGLESHLGIVRPSEVFARMARNLLNFYQNSFIVDKSAVIRNLLYLIHVVQPTNIQNTVLLCKINVHLKINGRQTLAMLSSIGEDPVPNVDELKATAKEVVDESCQPPEANAKKRSHANHLNVTYRVGMVMKHKRYDYLCVIYGWDPVCRLSSSWQMQMGVNLLQHKNMQPFYSVLVEDCSVRYAAQESLEISPSELVKARLHPKVGKYFSLFDGFRYIPNVELAKRYPEDL